MRMNRFFENRFEKVLKRGFAGFMTISRGFFENRFEKVLKRGFAGFMTISRGFFENRFEKVLKRGFAGFVIKENLLYFLFRPHVLL